MAYTTEIAELLAETVGKFESLNSYQLAGHVENLDFWLAEAEHALGSLDGYAKRRDKMEQGQQAYINAHDTRVGSSKDFSLNNEFGESEPISRVKAERGVLTSRVIESSKQAVRDAYYRFVRRSFRAKLISADCAKESLARIGTGWEPHEFAE